MENKQVLLYILIPFYGRKKGFTLIELVVVIAILGILAAILTPVVSGFVRRANEQADVSNARLLLTATTIAFGSDKLSLTQNEYKADEVGLSPEPFSDLVGQKWPVSRIGSGYFIVSVDFTLEMPDAIQVIRAVGSERQAYKIETGTFEKIE